MQKKACSFYRTQDGRNICLRCGADWFKSLDCRRLKSDQK